MYKIISIIATLFFFTLIGLANADIQDGLLLSGINYPNEIYANEEVEFHVEVLEVKARNGMGQLESSSPAIDAEVQLSAVSGGLTIDVRLNHVEEGRYKGAVLFPSPGEWKLTALARKPGDSLSVEHQDHDEAQNALGQTIMVKEPREEGVIYLIITFIFVILLMILYFIKKLIRIRFNK